MKKIITLMAASLLFATYGCSQSPGNGGIGQAAEAVGAAATKTISLTEAEFLKKVADYKNNPDEWKYLGDKPCIVDFYADWCRPCKMIAPVLDSLAADYDGKIYVYKVNIDKEKGIAATFGIRSIPTLFFIPMYGKPQIAQGVLPKDELKRAVDDILLNGKYDKWTRSSHFAR